MSHYYRINPESSSEKPGFSNQRNNAFGSIRNNKNISEGYFSENKKSKDSQYYIHIND